MNAPEHGGNVIVPASSRRIIETSKLAVTNKVELLTFEIGNKVGTHFGINIFKVKEIVNRRDYPITRLAGDDRHFVEGMISHREGVIPVVSLIKWVEGPQSSSEHDDKLVICQYNKSTVALLISREASIVRKDWGDIFESDYLKNGGKVTNVTKVPGLNEDKERLIFILDVEQLLDEMMPTNDEERLAGKVTEKISEKIGKILVADDSSTARNHIKRAFDQLGVTDFVMFENGRKLLDYVKSTDLSKIGLIITDLEMPEVSGFIVIKEIKSGENTKNLAVIVNSSMSGDNNVREALNLGASGFIAKTSPAELAKAIHEFARKI